MAIMLREIYRPVEKELDLVESTLLEMSSSRSETISEAVAKVLAGGGKRLRPALVLIAAKASRNGSGNSTTTLTTKGVRLAVAVELIHTASLIHDDVIDNASLRRGVRTLNYTLGNKTSVLVGDHVYSKVISILAEDGNIDVMRDIASAVCRMTESEMVQSMCRNDVNMPEERYFSIINGKTAALMSCCCRVGAMMNETRDGEVALLGDYGHSLGMAFQITDDMLDVTGEEAELGKSVWRDIREGCLTLPFIHTIRKAAATDRKWITDTLTTGEVDESAVNRLRDMMVEYKGMEYSLDKAREYGVACREKLRTLPESDSRTSLEMLVEFVLERVN
jgi:octaprenyl-diphosphate synthase